MIWDCFLFNGELDLLECRLTEMDPLDCRFVIAEAPLTFQGKPKPLHLRENKECFAPWLDRMSYLVTPEIDGDVNPWIREYAQRMQLLGAVLQLAEPDDLIVFGDVDEIPKGEDVWLHPGTVLGMRHHQFAIDWRNPAPWRGSVVTRPEGLRPVDGRWLRDQRQVWPVSPDAGWHLSWLGGIEAAKAKAHSFSHTEFTGKVCRWLDEGHCYEDGTVWDDNQELTVQQERVSISCAPRWIREGNCPESWFRWKE